MMNCTEAARHIAAYVDGDLLQEISDRLERHLVVCRDCASEALSLSIVRSRLRDDLTPAMPSDAFRTRTLQKLYTDNPHLATGAEEEENPAQYRLPIEI